MILPGVVKFMSDHYICGDTYRCVWAVREYPPSTEEQAILSQLADRSNITLRVYNRLVDSMEQRKIIQNATRRNKLMSGGTDVQVGYEPDNGQLVRWNRWISSGGKPCGDKDSVGQRD